MTFVTFAALYIMWFVLPLCALSFLQGIAAGQSRPLSLSIFTGWPWSFLGKKHTVFQLAHFLAQCPLKRQRT